MSDRFTEPARRVMRLAETEAERFGHEYIGSEHLLLALLREQSNLAARSLLRMGVELRHVRLQVEMIVRAGPDRKAVGKRPPTPAATRAIAHAHDEAGRLGHDFVSPEHLLLGLLHEPESVACEIFLNLGLRLDHLRAVIQGDAGLVAIQTAPSPQRAPLPPSPAPRDPAEENIKPGRQTDQLRASDQPAEREDLGVGVPDLNRPLTRPTLITTLAHAWELFLWLAFGKNRSVYEADEDEADSDPVAPPGLNLAAPTRQVLRLADREARQLGHDYIGTEHLLLGLLREGQGKGARLLSALGIDLSRVRLEVLKIARPASAPVGAGRLPITPRANGVLLLAAEEARRYDRGQVGTEHLLLGLAREQEGVASAVLADLGATAETLRGGLARLDDPE